MNLAMRSDIAASYKSRSQMARVITESWCEATLYCASCDRSALERKPPNAPASDFVCGKCGAIYELKSCRRWSKDRIADAGYAAMIRAIKNDLAPNLWVLHYAPDWTVRNLMLIPAFFFTETIIEKRPPLGPHARRAGWIGCNIRLSRVPPEGKLRIVDEGLATDPRAVRAAWQRATPLSTLKPSVRGWTLAVLNLIHALRRQSFSLSDLYAAEARLSAIYPKNHHVRAKIRQQLQVLRDFGIIEFHGGGEYSLPVR